MMVYIHDGVHIAVSLGKILPSYRLYMAWVWVVSQSGQPFTTCPGGDKQGCNTQPYAGCAKHTQRHNFTRCAQNSHNCTISLGGVLKYKTTQVAVWQTCKAASLHTLQLTLETTQIVNLNQCIIQYISNVCDHFSSSYPRFAPAKTLSICSDPKSCALKKQVMGQICAEWFSDALLCSSAVPALNLH